MDIDEMKTYLNCHCFRPAQVAEIGTR